MRSLHIFITHGTTRALFDIKKYKSHTAKLICTMDLRPIVAEAKIQFRPCRFPFVSETQTPRRGAPEAKSGRQRHFIYITKKHHSLFTASVRLIGPKERKLAHAKPSDAGASCLTAREREKEGRKKREGRALVSKGPWTRRVIILFQKQTTHTLRCSSS